MSFKFQTNRISTGKPKSFADLVADYQNKKAGQVKQASAATEPVQKVARTDAKQEEGESSGQLDVEPLHQEGESTPKVKGKDSGKKGSEGIASESASKKETKEAAEVKEACDCGCKNCGDCKCKGCTAKAEAQSKVAGNVQDTDNENEGEAEDSGQPKWEGQQKNNNDPDAGKHRDGDGDQKKAKATGKTKEANLDNIPEEKRAKPFGASEETEEVEAEDKEDKEVKAGGKLQFVKVANLRDKDKKWLQEYWGELYMPEYAKAMTEDK